MADPTYSIVSQQLTEELTPQGTFEDTWRVTYQTPSGVHGYVRLPAAVYSPENVHAAIIADVHTIEAVHQLGRSTPPPPAPAQ